MNPIAFVAGTRHRTARSLIVIGTLLAMLAAFMLGGLDKASAAPNEPPSKEAAAASNYIQKWGRGKTHNAGNDQTIKSFNVAMRDSFWNDYKHLSYSRLGTELNKGNGTAATKLTRKRQMAAALRMKGVTIVDISSSESAAVNRVIADARSRATFTGGDVSALGCSGLSGTRSYTYNYLSIPASTGIPATGGKAKKWIYYLNSCEVDQLKTFLGYANNFTCTLIVGLVGIASVVKALQNAGKEDAGVINLAALGSGCALLLDQLTVQNVNNLQNAGNGGVYLDWTTWTFTDHGRTIHASAPGFGVQRS